MSRHDKTFFDDRITQLSLLMHFAQAQFLEPQFLILKIRKNGKGSSINDVIPEGEGGGNKNRDLE